MGTTILSFEDRVVIETLRHENRSLKYIADYLGFSQTTIFNEVHRLAGEYHATSAQSDHETKISCRGRKCSLTANLKQLIEEKIKVQKWSQLNKWLMSLELPTRPSIIGLIKAFGKLT